MGDTKLMSDKNISQFHVNNHTTSDGKASHGIEYFSCESRPAKFSLNEVQPEKHRQNHFSSFNEGSQSFLQPNVLPQTPKPHFEALKQNDEVCDVFRIWNDDPLSNENDSHVNTPPNGTGDKFRADHVESIFNISPISSESNLEQYAQEGIKRNSNTYTARGGIPQYSFLSPSFSSKNAYCNSEPWVITPSPKRTVGFEHYTPASNRHARNTVPQDSVYPSNDTVHSLSHISRIHLEPNAPKLPAFPDCGINRHNVPATVPSEELTHGGPKFENESSGFSLLPSVSLYGKKPLYLKKIPGPLSRARIVSSASPEKSISSVHTSNLALTETKDTHCHPLNFPTHYSRKNGSSKVGFTFENGRHSWNKRSEQEEHPHARVNDHSSQGKHSLLLPKLQNDPKYEGADHKNRLSSYFQFGKGIVDQRSSIFNQDSARSYSSNSKLHFNHPGVRDTKRVDTSNCSSSKDEKVTCLPRKKDNCHIAQMETFIEAFEVPAASTNQSLFCEKMAKGDDMGSLYPSQPPNEPFRIKRKRTIIVPNVSQEDDEPEQKKVKTKKLKSWKTRYDELCEYRKSFGNCLVPTNYCELGHWVHHQRQYYKMYTTGKKGPMTRAKIDALESVGFVWSVQAEDNEAAWWTMYQALSDFHTEHGHCCVPTRYPPNRRLGTWVMRQRKNYKLFINEWGGSMTKFRIEALEGLGFTWASKARGKRGKFKYEVNKMPSNVHIFGSKS